MHDLFPGNPLEHLDAYRQFTEWSLLVDGPLGRQRRRSRLRDLGLSWQQFCRPAGAVEDGLRADVLLLGPARPNRSSIFSSRRSSRRPCETSLPRGAARLAAAGGPGAARSPPGHVRGPTRGSELSLRPGHQTKFAELSASELFRQIPVSYRICRMYAETSEHDALLSAALDALVDPGGSDDRTNM